MTYINEILIDPACFEIAWDYCLEHNIIMPSDWVRVNVYCDLPACNLSELYTGLDFNIGPCSFSGSGLRDQYSYNGHRFYNIKSRCGTVGTTRSSSELETRDIRNTYT